MNDNSKKEQLINNIKNLENIYMNEDQKKIAIRILENIPIEEVQSVNDFIFYKRNTGFAFDYSPEIAMGRLAILREDVDKRINVNDSIEEDENKLIIGDNYNALKNLLVTHKEKIDIIYIDPPYNTESAKFDGNQSSKEGIATKFIYKDKFGRGGWLNMMKARLDLAKELLSRDGVIFISIDDSEQAYLKVLMDDIFGEENFIANLVGDKKNSQNDAKKFQKNHEYILVYQKSQKFQINVKTKLNEEKGKKLSINIGTESGYLFEAKNLGWTMYYNPNSGEKIPKMDYDPKNVNENSDFSIYKDIVEYTSNGFITIRPKMKDGKLRTWTWSIETVEKRIDEIIIDKNNDEYYLWKKDIRERKKIPHKSIIEQQSGARELNDLGLNFNYPKSSDFIKGLIDKHPNKNSIILDFFAGSGTTGHAVMQLNRDDDGNRKFILCTNNENNIADDVTYERLFRIINGRDTKREREREREMIW